MLPEDDIVNNMRISRCLFYVSEILGRVLGQGFPQAGEAPAEGAPPAGDFPRRRAKKAAFFLTDSQRSALAAYGGSVYARDIAAQLSRFADENGTRRFTAAWITAWLTAEGFMEQTEQGKRATDPGAEPGIETSQREHAVLINMYNTRRSSLFSTTLTL